jgi:hypothetical protein
MEQKICIASGLPSVIPDFSGKGIKPKIALRFYGLFLFGGFLQASLTSNRITFGHPGLLRERNQAQNALRTFYGLFL